MTSRVNQSLAKTPASVNYRSARPASSHPDCRAIPSADFCAAVRSPYGDLSPVSGTQRRPPEVRPTAFTARSPDLPPRPLMTVDFAISCSLVRPGRPRYQMLVHQAAALLHAVFRPHLAMTPLRFANPSPSSGWIEDFHLQAVVHTRHTTQAARATRAPKSSDRFAQWSEARANLFCKELRLFPGRIVPAIVNLVVIDEFVICSLCTTPRGLIVLARKDAHGGRD